MTITEIRTRYSDNIVVIDRLKERIKPNEDNTNVIEAIKLVEKEQEFLYKKIRSHVYKKLADNKKIRKLLDDYHSNEIVIDKENISISNVEEKPINKEPATVINITEKNYGHNKNHLYNEMLKEKRNKKVELKDAKIVYDGSYKIIYDKGTKVYEHKINDVVLDYNLKEKQSDFNINIMRMLEDFDEINNTNLYNQYMTNNISVTYNFSKIGKKADKKQVNKIKKIAKKETKNFRNVTIIDDRAKKFRNGLFLTGMAVLTGFLSNSFIKKEKENRNFAPVNEYATVNEAGPTDASVDKVADLVGKTNEEIEQISTEVFEKTVEEKNVVTKTDSKPKKIEVKEEKKEETKESIKVGDTYKLGSVDLYNASTDDTPLGDTEYAEETKSIFEVNLIAVVYNNQVMRLVNNNSIDIDALENICKDKYGDDFKIFVNPNELDEDGNLITENVGWIQLSQWRSKGKVLKR